MSKFYRLMLMIVVATLIFGVGTSGTKAQDAGNFIISGTFGEGINTLSPIYCQDAECALDIARLMPNLITADPADNKFKSGTIIPGNLAKSWTRGKDGVTWTIELRKDLKWSDGKPVTSNDVLTAYKAQLDPASEAPGKPALEADIKDVKAPDDYTLVITLNNAECTSAFQKIDEVYGTGGIPPAHVLGTDFSKLKDAEANLKPTVTSGQYKFDELRIGEQLRLLADQSYPDKQGAKVENDGWIEKNYTDQNAMTEAFLNGGINYILTPPVGRRDEIYAAEKAGKFKTLTYAGTAWDHIALNLADPTNPVNGVDKDGKAIDQGHHPVFGDVRVRKAFQLGINVPDIIKGAVFGHGTQMTSNIGPANVYYAKDLKPVAFDQEAAKKLLDEAGFVVPSGGGTRVAKGAKYAKDGTPLKFSIMYNTGNKRREAVSTIIKDELSQIGFEVDVQSIDFNVMNDNLNKETFDAAVVSRGSAYDDSIDWSFLFDPAQDVVGTASNVGSYNNPELLKVMKAAASVPDCDAKKTAELYAQFQKILQDDQPYIWLYVQENMEAWNANVGGINTFPTSSGYTDTWRVTAK